MHNYKNKKNDIIKLHLWYDVGLSVIRKFNNFSEVSFVGSLQQALQVLHDPSTLSPKYVLECWNDLAHKINNILRVVQLATSFFKSSNPNKFKGQISAIDELIHEVALLNKFCNCEIKFGEKKRADEGLSILSQVKNKCDNLNTDNKFSDFIKAVLAEVEACVKLKYGEQYRSAFEKEKLLLFEKVWLSILGKQSKKIFNLDGRGIYFACKVKELLHLRKALLDEYLARKSQEDIKVRVNLCLLHKKISCLQQDSEREISQVREQQANIKNQLTKYGWGVGLISSVAYFFKMNKSPFIEGYFTFTNSKLGTNFTVSEIEILSIVNPCLLAVSQACVGGKFWKVLGYGVTNHIASLTTLAFDDLLYKQVNLGVCRSILRNKAVIKWFLGVLVSVGTTAIFDELSVENLSFILCSYVMGGSFSALKSAVQKFSQKYLQEKPPVASKKSSYVRNKYSVVAEIAAKISKATVFSVASVSLSLLGRFISKKVITFGSVFMASLINKNDFSYRRSVKNHESDFAVEEQGFDYFFSVMHNVNQTEIKPIKKHEFINDFYYQNEIEFSKLNYTEAFYMSAYGTYRLHRESDRGKTSTISDPIKSELLAVSCDRFATMDGTLADFAENIQEYSGITHCLLDIKHYFVPVKGNAKYNRHLLIIQPMAITKTGIIRTASPLVTGHAQHKGHDFYHPDIFGAVLDRTAVKDPDKDEKWDGIGSYRYVPERMNSIIVDSEYLVFSSTKFGKINANIYGYVDPDPHKNPIIDYSDLRRSGFDIKKKLYWLNTKEAYSVCGYFDPIAGSIFGKMWTYKTRSPLRLKGVSYVLDNEDGRKFGFQTDMLDLDTRLETVINAPTNEDSGFSKDNTVPVTWELNARIRYNNGTVGAWKTLISDDITMKGNRKVFKTYDGAKVIFEHAGSIYEAAVTYTGKNIIDSTVTKLSLGDDISAVEMFKQSNKFWLAFTKENHDQLFLYDYYTSHNPPKEEPLPISKSDCKVNRGFSINSIHTDPFDLNSEEEIVAVYTCKDNAGMQVQKIPQNNDPRGSTFSMSNMILPDVTPIKIISGVYQLKFDGYPPAKISTTTFVQSFSESERRVQFFVINYGGFDGVFNLVWPPIFENPYDISLIVFLMLGGAGCCSYIAVGGCARFISNLYYRENNEKQLKLECISEIELDKILGAAEYPKISLTSAALIKKYLIGSSLSSEFALESESEKVHHENDDSSRSSEITLIESSSTSSSWLSATTSSEEALFLSPKSVQSCY